MGPASRKAQIRVRASERTLEQEIGIQSHTEVLRPVIEMLWKGEARVIDGPEQIAVVGHRVVHGGVAFQETTRIIDPFNVFLVTLTAFVGLTTSLFSRPYMRIEMANGRLSAPRLRLYHSMYQLFMTTMLIALTTNNMGLVCVFFFAAASVRLRIAG